MIYLAAITIGSQLVLVADVPKFDARQSCRAATGAAIALGRTSENCLEDERAAHDLLAKSWADFSASDKAHCLGLIKAGGGPSYVELLSCLEMSRDARVIASERAKAQAGQAAPTTDTSTTGAGTSAAPTRQRAKP